MGHRCSALNAENHFSKTVHKDNLEERNVTVSVNIAHIDPEDVAVGDLVVVPLDPSPLDPLTKMTDCQIISCH